MGIPKFYRWMSERYPCLSQVVKDHQIPEFDNLYLDMNGIIHPCSHPNDDDPHFRITEEQIFSSIFHYIEVLFRIIKPQKVFFMAVDGVAPRAKMNQQRSRRFRSAREAEANIRKALQKGEILPTEERFDSNCITPGTEFMVRLHEQLKYFVNKKIGTDPGWQGVKIYLSGHETPGEGEHKIMDFIRYERSQPGYDPNTRHCMYGLDADLIILGLTSHDPHFSLLREEVRFGKNVKRVNNPEDITFHLLHLSLLREYIDLEFQSLKDKLSYGYDLEKIIDDWILMGFLVGNDFIPNLPNFHINHDSLPYLWQIYKDVMPTLDGYLHDSGFLSLARFQRYLESLSKFDLEKFEDAYTDLKWLESKLGPSNEEESLEVIFEDDAVDGSRKELETMALESPPKGRKLRDYLEGKGVLKEAEAEDDGDFSEEHEKFKLRYYKEKFELKEVEREFIERLSFKYVEAIQWILHYYFNGLPSWGWYFPYHYAPYVSDIKDFQHHEHHFDIGKPFLPFEQLLAVLPAASKKLLPEPFQSLMIMEDSPIIDYYPPEFKTDLNGKRQDWEAVVLIPFIDEKRLLAAMKDCYPRLKKGEISRNRHSPCLIYTYDREKSEKYPSSLPNVFPDIECCHARSEEIPIDRYRLSPDQLVKGLLSGVKYDGYFPGFPTLKHVPHSGELKKVAVKVFSMHSRGESMLLRIDESNEPDVKEVAESLLGHPCNVGWPHLVEAFVTSVSDGKRKFILAKEGPEKHQEITLSASDISAWNKQSSCEKQFYLERKAIDVGMVHILVEACQIQGKKYICGAKGAVQLEKQWSDWAVTFPMQVTVKNVDIYDETDAGPPCGNITDLFPVGTECFMLAVPHYGSSGKVIEVDAKQNRVRVQLSVVPEPNLLSLIFNQEDFADVYMPAHIMAKRLGLPSHVLAQITGKVFVSKGDKEGSSKLDIGLNLKFSKQDKEVLGYARRSGGSWTYSPKTERIISTYQEKFPQVFEILSSPSSKEMYKASDVFPEVDQSEVLSEVESWLKTLPCHNQKAVKCGSSTLDEPVIKQIEEVVKKFKDEKQNKKSVKVRVKPTVLHRPMKHMGQVPPDPAADFELFDRVVNVRTLGVTPYGLKGTIVGIHQGESKNNQVRYEVLFDEPFMGGQSLRGSFENKLFVVEAWSLLNLTYGTRLEAKKKCLPYPPVQQRRSSQPLEGGPADYKPRGGSRYSQESLGSWQSPINISSPERRQSNGYTKQSPRDRFPSPRNSRFSAQSQFSPPGNSPHQQTPVQPRILLKPQGSPFDPSRSRNPHDSSVTGKARDTCDDSSALSAKESERVIRELLHMDGQPKTNLSLSSPQTMFSSPDVSSVSPAIPSSPVSPSVPSGYLVLACRENRWPDPGFSHHHVPQGFITTVCVAGKLFQGFPATNIIESTESAARIALVNCGLLPQSFSLQPNPMNSCANPFFPSPSSPYTPPTFSSCYPMAPNQGSVQFRSPQWYNKSKKQPYSENSPQTTRVSASYSKVSSSPTTTPSATTESRKMRKSGSLDGHHIPHEASLKNKGVPRVPEDKAKGAGDLDSPKTSEPELNEPSLKPGENKVTPKSANVNQRKPKPKLLAPSFFGETKHKN